MTDLIDQKQTSQTTEGEQTPGKTSAGSDVNSSVTTTSAGTNQLVQSTTSTVKTFGQDDVNKMVGQARQEARDRILKDLGVDDPEDLKTMIGEYRKQQEANMTELEKSQANVKRLEIIEAQNKEAGESLLAAEQAISNFVSAQMKTLEIPDHVSPLIESMPMIDRLNYLTEHGAEFAVDKPAKKKSVNTNASGKGGSDKSAEETERKAAIKRRYSIY
jgi:hypothetical protein